MNLPKTLPIWLNVRRFRDVEFGLRKRQELVNLTVQENISRLLGKHERSLDTLACRGQIWTLVRCGLCKTLLNCSGCPTLLFLLFGCSVSSRVPLPFLRCQWKRTLPVYLEFSG